jgi:AcrR family transcriptional regulator
MARRVEAIAEQRIPLSKERLLRTAMSLADQGGIDSLSMRKLAQELGVEAMSLYYYVASKHDILSAIVEDVVSEIELPSGSDWKAALRRSALSFHDALARHRWAANLMMTGTGVGLARVRYMDAVLRRLREAGFSPELTHHAYHALDSHIMGSTLWAAAYATTAKANPDFARNFLQKLPLSEYPDFAEHAQQHIRKTGPKDMSEFEFGLDLILDSLERMREAASGRSVSTRQRTPRPLRELRRPKRRGR